MHLIRKWWDQAWDNHYSNIKTKDLKVNTIHDDTTVPGSSQTIISLESTNDIEKASCANFPVNSNQSLMVSSHSSSGALTPLVNIEKETPPSEASLSILPQETQPTQCSIVRLRHGKVMHGHVRGNARLRKKGKLKFRSIKE